LMGSKQTVYVGAGTIGLTILYKFSLLYPASVHVAGSTGRALSHQLWTVSSILGNQKRGPRSIGHISYSFSGKEICPDAQHLSSPGSCSASSRVKGGTRRIKQYTSSSASTSTFTEQ
jgi:hypothetical protein